MWLLVLTLIMRVGGIAQKKCYFLGTESWMDLSSAKRIILLIPDKWQTDILTCLSTTSSSSLMTLYNLGNRHLVIND